MVEVPIPKEKWSGKIGEVTLGATAEKGGTRSIALKTGGETGMPFLSYEGAMPNRPLIAGEVLDSTYELPAPVRSEFGEVVNDPVAWAKTWVDKFGADIICVKLVSTSPDEANRSPQEAAETVKRVLDAIKVPIIVYGCGNEERDAKTFELVSNIAAKERLLIGHAEDTSYKSIAAATMANHHTIISFSNLDINLAKQINILLTDFGVKKDAIIMDPLMAALGMGLEYSYSVMERIRLAAFMGDGMLQVPLICDTSASWKAKEAAEDVPGPDGIAERAVWWETTTALAALIAGADILIMRSPRATSIVKRAMADLTGGD
jgi:acetyl-CoA decarbonylase/synthase, CODH/ACS complex subunit delta